MIVEVQRKGHNITGLKIGATNVRRYFTRGSSSIDIHLDHLQIQCDLQPRVLAKRTAYFRPALGCMARSEASSEREQASSRCRRSGAGRPAFLPAEACQLAEAIPREAPSMGRRWRRVSQVGQWLRGQPRPAL